MGRVVAFLFLVHAALLGFSLPASASLLPRDQFGNVLCTTFGQASEHGKHERDKGHSGMPACCSMGCAMHGGPLPAPSTPSRPIVQPMVLEVPFVLFEGVGSGAVETPRNTRGPPFLG